jgi:hypothetical protein
MSDVTGRHTLKQPIEIRVIGPEGDRTEFIREVHIRPVAKAADLLCMDKHDGSVAKSFALIAHLSDLTYAQVGELHPEDFKTLSEQAEAFI